MGQSAGSGSQSGSEGGSDCTDRTCRALEATSGLATVSVCVDTNQKHLPILRCSPAFSILFGLKSPLGSSLLDLMLKPSLFCSWMHGLITKMYADDGHDTYPDIP